MSSQSREELEVDVVIVGAGPAGLAAAIHLVNEARRRGEEAPAIALVEKARELGAHSLSGAVMDPRGLDALIPEWREQGAPIESEVTEETMLFLTARKALKIPFVPASMAHHGCCIVSLEKLVAWLGEKAESLGIDIFPGFSAGGLLEEGGRVVGVRTGQLGIDKKGEARGNYEPGYDIKARLTLLAEGVRGTLSTRLIRDRGLADGKNPTLYAAGAKEVWRLPAGKVAGGRVWHTLGWPLRRDSFGGAFIYEMGENLVSIGLVIGLDSPDPRLDMHGALQRFKTHPFVREYLEGGEAVAYGAKAIPEGGYWAVPKLAVDGALLLGDSAGLVNAMRLKGIHLAIESGISAAEAALDAFRRDDLSAASLMSYDRKIRDGAIGRELHAVRNFRQPYQKGLFRGMLHTGLQFLSGGRGVRDRYPAEEDHLRTRRIEHEPQGREPLEADGKYLFDKVSSVYLAAAKHEENQPAHLVVLDPDLCGGRCAEEFGNPCVSFCPAGVYEMVDSAGAKKLQINASNCVHCKTCDIADPYGVITWLPPEGGGGPRYKST